MFFPAKVFRPSHSAEELCTRLAAAVCAARNVCIHSMCASLHSRRKFR